MCERGTEDVRQQREVEERIQHWRKRQGLECKEGREGGRERRGRERFLKRSRSTGLCDHLSCSRCASCPGGGAAGVQRARLLWRNLTRPRKSSAAYSTQRSGLIASLAFPVTKSHPSATQGRDHDNRQLSLSLSLPLSLPLPPPLRNPLSLWSNNTNCTLLSAGCPSPLVWSKKH